MFKRLTRRVKASIARFPLAIADIKEMRGSLFTQARQVLSEIDFISGPLNRILSGGADMTAGVDIGEFTDLKLRAGRRYRFTFNAEISNPDVLIEDSGVVDTEGGPCKIRIYDIQTEPEIVHIFVEILRPSQTLTVDPQRATLKVLPILIPIAWIVGSIAVGFVSFFSVKGLKEVKEITWSPSILVLSAIAGLWLVRSGTLKKVIS